MIWRGLGQLQIRKFEDALLSFERGYQNNPTGGIFIGIALAYVLLGKDQELNTLYERDQYTKQYSKIFPMIYKVKI